MTRKEMIAACVDEQIARGVTKKENRNIQIKARLNGLSGAGIKKMGYRECLSWYGSIFKA